MSPLQMTFDFEAPDRSPMSVSSNPSMESLRPRTSDGIANKKKSTTGLAPPLLPPIPRVASREEKARSAVSYESGGSDSEGIARARKQRDDSDNVSVSSKKSGKSTRSGKSFKIFELTIDELNKPPALPISSRPASSGSDMRPGTASSMPRMEGTLFPKADIPLLPPLRTTTSSGMTMDRSFIDSRDKPFQPPVAKMRTSSTPDLLSMTKGSRNVSQKSPLSPPSATSAHSAPLSRPGFGSTTSDPTLLLRKPSNSGLPKDRAPSTLSGTTARSKNSRQASDDLPPQTIGTPYQETSMSFPMPEQVATRPTTSAGTDATIRGYPVITHHTSSQPPSKPETAKTEKRKTKFLNPVALFSRRKSAQDDVETQKEKAAQEAAIQRQKNVAMAGVKKVPDDFDPRIRGKVVHDFSAPRNGNNRQSGRSFTYNDAAEGQRNHQARLQSTNSAPLIPVLQQDGADVRQSMFSGNSNMSGTSRKSVHAPVFFEHLSEAPGASDRVNAERLENRDFLQRASHVSHTSQESAVLPPFARRSQVLDPTQAAFFVDDGSKRSSDPSSSSGQTDPNRESNTSSLSSGISPITARNSVMPQDPTRQSMSPISPTSPSTKGYLPGSRPKSMASSLLRDSTVLSADEEEEIHQQRLRSQRALSSGPPPISPPSRSAPLPPQSLSPPMTSPLLPGSQTSTPTFSNGSTPGEEQVASSVRLSKVPNAAAPKVVEKRASAAGHSKRSSSSAMPKHHVSNASRFSFQMGGGSAREEQALEEKARKVRSTMPAFAKNGKGATGGSDEDEDDYFDEDAMDDMDEMEMREEDDEDEYDDGFGAQRAMKASMLPPPASLPQPMNKATPMSVQDARLQLLVSESDGEDNDGEDEESASEGGYFDHPDFVDYAAYQHSRGHSLTNYRPIPQPGATDNQQQHQPQHQRITSDAESVLTLNTNLSPGPHGNAAFVQDGLSPHDSVPGGVGGAKPRSGFYMQPTAAGYSRSPSAHSPAS